MRALARKRILAPLAVLSATVGFALVGSNATGAPALVTVDLCGTTGTLNPLPSTAPSISVPIWGFNRATAELGDGTPDCSTAPAATLPGPLLDVNQGDLVTIKVKNLLPTLSATGDTCTGSAVLSNVSAPSLFVGLTVAGPGIPAGVAIASIGRASTTLSAPIDSGATTITVGSPAGFPSCGNFFIRIEDEALEVTGGQGTTTWTVSRGQLSTTAADHASGTPVLSQDESLVTISQPATASGGGVALVLGHRITFEAPGITFSAGATYADPGATRSLTFTASAPGTYLYQSGGDAGRQEAMGLYGALIVRPTSAPDTPIPGQAYLSATTAYDVEAPLVLGQLDPNFNAAPDSFDMNDYLATYWLINGRAYPDTAPGITATAGQKVLLRYVNAGYDNTSMALLGMHEQVLARDARLLNNPFQAATETIPAGATEDAIATMPATAPPGANGFPLFNRNLHVTNGTACVTTNPCVPNAFHTPGGMLTFIHS